MGGKLSCDEVDDNLLVSFRAQGKTGLTLITCVYKLGDAVVIGHGGCMSSKGWCIDTLDSCPPTQTHVSVLAMCADYEVTNCWSARPSCPK